jgi:hypothetical protein
VTECTRNVVPPNEEAPDPKSWGLEVRAWCSSGVCGHVLLIQRGPYADEGMRRAAVDYAKQMCEALGIMLVNGLTWRQPDDPLALPPRLAEYDLSVAHHGPQAFGRRMVRRAVWKTEATETRRA